MVTTEQINSLGEPYTRCEAEYHLHLEDKCFAVTERCEKSAGHDMRGWHRNPEKDLTWNFDHRDTCPKNCTCTDYPRNMNVYCKIAAHREKAEERFSIAAKQFEGLLAGVETGIIQRRWECYDDNSDCTEESVAMFRERTTGHQSCRWYWHLWTVEQDKIEVVYQQALEWADFMDREI